jgi:HK97 family phage prohead protease
VKHLTLHAGVVTASASARTITGTAVTYDAVHGASTGPVQFAPGSLHTAADLTRVKLLIDHDPSQPVGYLTSLTDSPQRLQASFHVPAGEAGDLALIQAAAGLRDGMSVGVWLEDGGFTVDDDDVVHVTSGTLREVSLLALPADDDARVSDVAASRHHPSGETMPEQTTATIVAPVAAAAATTPAPPPEPAPLPAPVVQAAPIRPATTEARGMNLQAAMVEAAQVLKAGDYHRVAAALGDIVPANDVAPGYLRPQWVGELWKAALVARPLIDAIGPTRPLTGLKVQGFRKDYTDLVDTYAGNKTAIPSGTFVTAPAEATAARWAGGNDIDRIYLDLGDPGFLESWFTAATDDYKLKTEEYVATALLAAATAVVPAPATITAALSALGLAAASIGANISFVSFASDVWADFIELPADLVPWWLQAQGSINLSTTNGNAGGITFSVNQALPAGTVLGGDSRSATWYEVNPPIKLQALNIPNGGVDVGVFGYGALLVNDARALLKAVVTPVP